MHETSQTAQVEDDEHHDQSDDDDAKAVAPDHYRSGVRVAILDTTTALVAEHGPLSVTMSQIAQQTGIGRATLYKYFPDVEAILAAWHERHVRAHLDQLTALAGEPASAGRRVAAVLEAYALITYARQRHAPELSALVHRSEPVAEAERELAELVRELLVRARQTGEVRDDVPEHELVSYCLHALGAASSLSSAAAVRRLVGVTLDGLRLVLTVSDADQA